MKQKRVHWSILCQLKVSPTPLLVLLCCQNLMFRKQKPDAQLNIKTQQKLPHLTKISCIYEEPSLKILRGSRASGCWASCAPTASSVPWPWWQGCHHSCKAPNKSQINLLLLMVSLMLWVGEKITKAVTKTKRAISSFWTRQWECEH